MRRAGWQQLRVSATALGLACQLTRRKITAGWDEAVGPLSSSNLCKKITDGRSWKEPFCNGMPPTIAGSRSDDSKGQIAVNGDDYPRAPEYAFGVVRFAPVWGRPRSKKSSPPWMIWTIPAGAAPFASSARRCRQATGLRRSTITKVIAEGVFPNRSVCR